MGRQRLPAFTRLADPARRLARRRLGRAARVHNRDRRLRRLLARLCTRTHDRPAGSGSCAAGSSGSIGDTELARDHRGRLPACAAKSCGGFVDCLGRNRAGRWSASRWLDRRSRLVAVDLRAQRPARGRDSRLDQRRRAGEERQRVPATDRPGRRVPVRAGARRPRLRPRRGVPVRLDEPSDRRSARRWRGRVCSLRRLRAAGRAADAEARPVLAAQLRDREHRDVRDVRRRRDPLLLPRHLPATGSRLRGAQDRPHNIAGNGGHVRPLAPRRCTCRPLRPTPIHGRGAGDCRSRGSSSSPGWGRTSRF